MFIHGACLMLMCEPIHEPTCTHEPMLMIVRTEILCSCAMSPCSLHIVAEHAFCNHVKSAEEHVLFSGMTDEKRVDTLHSTTGIFLLCIQLLGFAPELALHPTVLHGFWALHPTTGLFTRLPGLLLNINRPT